MDLQTVIISHIGARAKKTPSGWMSLNCPMCSDKRKRGGFKYSEIISYHCFNCGYKASYTPGRLLSKRIRELLLGIGVPDQKIKELQLQAMKEKDDDFQVQKADKWTLDFKEQKLPNNAVPFEHIINQKNPPTEALFVYKYIMDRKLDLFKGLYWSPDPYMKINERFILPFYFNNKVVGYTSRLIKEYENVPKYYSSVQPGYMYNMDNLFKERKYTVIVEGVLDALTINAVSSLGNKLTQPQIDLINGIGNTVIVCPDRDKAGTNLIDVALENNWMVSFPDWEDNIKDTADAVKEYGQVYTLKSIIQSAEHNTAKIEVLKRLGKK